MGRLICINPPVYDPDGDLRLAISGDTDLEAITRRVSRTATLDGGAVLTDTGYSAADRTFLVNLPGISSEDSARLRRWVRDFATLIVATEESVFEAAPEQFTYSDGTAQLKLLVISDLVAG